jgi:flavin reductase (DIM6/NTAB) family NADH-FMN oxidoreductase RutF
MSSEQPTDAPVLATSPSDGRWFRQVLGQYPTGVCVVTAMHRGGPAGMAVGSFTAVSLDPPLVAFLPDKSSTSWPKIESTGSFCVNVIRADQEHVCRRFASKAPDKFEGLPWRAAGSGSPIVEGVVAWIDCDLEAVHEAGDHYIVVGRVRELQLEKSGLPLLFYQGGYGRFTPLSMAASGASHGLADQLRFVDLARPEMEAMTAELSCQCVATALLDGEVVVVASAGSVTARGAPTLVGARLPFVPPLGAPFAAWGHAELEETWLSAAAGPGERASFVEKLDAVRRRGCSIGLLNSAQRHFAATLEKLVETPTLEGSGDFRRIIRQLVYDPVDLDEDSRRAIRIITVPVFDEPGHVRLLLTVYGFPKPSLEDGIERVMERALAGGHRASADVSRRSSRCEAHPEVDA